MAAKSLDPVKAMIAQAVQHHMVTGPTRPPLMPMPSDVESVEASIIGPLETMVRVKTLDQGVRYFNIKVSEQM